jgi:hypothetical protein
MELSTMGSLKPDTTYIYERDGNTVYAREFGADPNTRTPIGWDYDKSNPSFDPRTGDGRPLHDHIMDSKMWGEIRREARTNITLQKALDRVIMIYKLSKDKLRE